MANIGRGRWGGGWGPEGLKRKREKRAWLLVRGIFSSASRFGGEGQPRPPAPSAAPPYLASPPPRRRRHPPTNATASTAAPALLARAQRTQVLLERLPLAEQRRLAPDHSLRPLVVAQDGLEPEHGVDAVLDVRLVGLEVGVRLAPLGRRVVVEVEAHDELDPLLDVPRVGLGEDEVVLVQRAYEELDEAVRRGREGAGEGQLHRQRQRAA